MDLKDLIGKWLEKERESGLTQCEMNKDTMGVYISVFDSLGRKKVADLEKDRVDLFLVPLNNRRYLPRYINAYDPKFFKKLQAYLKMVENKRNPYIV